MPTKVMLVSDLPDALRHALRAANYQKRDVDVKTAAQYQLSSPGGAGQRGFTFVVDLRDGSYEAHQGSWGGANPFERRAADVDNGLRPLDDNTAVLKGTASRTAGFAYILVSDRTFTSLTEEAAAERHAELMARAARGDEKAAAQLVQADIALEEGVPLTHAVGFVLTSFDRKILECFRSLTSAGRKNEFERMVWDKKATRTEINDAVDAMVARGLLKKNKAGAISITTDGKDALAER